MNTIAKRFQIFLLDLDGVVYIGDKLLPGARSSIDDLRSTGKTIRFLTNDPRPTRQEAAMYLHGLGVEADVEEIITCGWAAATYLRDNRIQTAYVIGSDGLRSEISREGILLTDDDDTKAVIVGCDENVCYDHIRRASMLIRKGARFIATNEDSTFPTPDGPAPATGAIVAAVRTASGKLPSVIGKPHRAMFDAALRDFDPLDAVMIGDSMATDILGAQRLGIASILVSGSDYDIGQEKEMRAPDFVISTLADLFDD